MLSCVQLFATPWTVACQVPLSIGFSHQEYWSELPFPILGDLPNPGIKHTSLVSPELAGRFLTTSSSWEVPVRILFSSVQFSRSVVSHFSRPHEPQQARPPCPSPTLGVYPNSCPLSRWCHPTISSSVIPFSYCLQSFPASGSFQMSQLFTSEQLNT